MHGPKKGNNFKPTNHRLISFFSQNMDHCLQEGSPTKKDRNNQMPQRALIFEMFLEWQVPLFLSKAITAINNYNVNYMHNKDVHI